MKINIRITNFYDLKYSIFFCKNTGISKNN